MKRFFLLFMSMILLAALSGCKGKESCPAADPMLGAESSSLGEENSDNMITSDMLSQSVYAALQVEWSAWNAKDEMQKLISSHLPGHIYKQFDTWTECEEFLGFSVFNPLEESEFEKGSYVGMPEGYADASRFNISFYGESPEKVNWIHVDSGYRDGDVRITVNAQIYPGMPKENREDEKPLITEDSGERYVATTAVLVRGPVTYSIRVIGEPDMQTQVKETLEKVLPYF